MCVLNVDINIVQKLLIYWNGHGCPICNHSGRYNWDIFVSKVKEKSKCIELSGEYVNCESIIHCRCKKCENEWDTKARNLLRGNGCPKCNQSNPKLLTRQFKEIMNNINPNIIVGEYNGNKERIDCECKICGYKWEPFATVIRSGHGCPNCKALKDRLTQEEFANKVKEVNPYFQILGNYQTNKIPIKVKCLKCGKIFEANPSYILRGKNVCRDCYKRELRSTNEYFKDKLMKTNPYVIPLEEYTDTNTKIKVKCSVCGNIWWANPSNILNGTGCPMCSLSHGEKEIKSMLDRYNIEYEPQKQFEELLGVKGKHLSYDFYLPHYNLLIEYQGKQHLQPIDYFGGEEQFKIQKEHDRRKMEYANKHNINLLTILYNENIKEKIIKTLNLETVETTGH